MLERTSHEIPAVPVTLLGASAPVSKLKPHAVAAALRIAPLRGLKDWVAVNPWMGWSDRPIEMAMDEIRRVSGEKVLPSMAWFSDKKRAGAFSERHLERAARRRGLDPVKLLACLEAGGGEGAIDAPVLVSEVHGLTEFLCQQAAGWCAKVHGGSPLPWKGGLYAIWRAAQTRDPEPEWKGVPGWRSWFENAPESVEEALANTPGFVVSMGWNPEQWCLKLLAGVPGWASWLRGKGYLEQDLSGLLELLAIRVVQEVALSELLPRGRPVSKRISQEDPATRSCLQDALEDAWMESFLSKLFQPPPRRSAPEIQAAFCIDVRSEPLRRALEAVDEGVRTAGFAGFFGLALRLVERGRNVDLCPAPLAPRYKMMVRSLPKGPGLAWIRSGAANLPGVELTGWTALPAIAKSLLPMGRKIPAPADVPASRLEWLDGRPLEASDKADIAQSLLANLGFSIHSRLVLLVGHTGRSANNPHAASLHCGACGGRGGAVNARIAAALLNDPEVRTELAWRGKGLPLSSVFVAAEHDTTLDEIRILARDQVPATHRSDLERIESALVAAGERVRLERAAALEIRARTSQEILPLLRRRAMDPAEVRPEWGLASNAAFLVAPRSRSTGRNLEGRAFLHEHDPSAQGAEGRLEAILTAPVVVASWINLQYLSSTVDPDRQGAGPKLRHNRIGSTGVVAGDGADLLLGLAQESVQNPDGSSRHEPLRLQVVVEDSRERIDAVLKRHASLANLVVNGWIRVFALEGSAVWRRGTRDWEVFAAA